MNYSTSEQVRLIREKIAFEKDHLEKMKKGEVDVDPSWNLGHQESYVLGMEHVLDIILNAEKYDDSSDEEVTDEDRTEIARLVGEGNTSGILDSEGSRTSWELTVNKFKN